MAEDVNAAQVRYYVHVNNQVSGRPKVLIISGSVGVGKSSVAEAISEKLSEKSIQHAVIDLDYLCYAFPRPKDDYFHRKLGRKNLAAIWPNYKEIGVHYLIIPNVVENQDDVDSIRTAIPMADITVVRLGAKLGTVQSRLRGRASGSSLKWHLNRAVELTEQLENANVEDLVVNTDNVSVNEVANELVEKWLGRFDGMRSGGTVSD